MIIDASVAGLLAISRPDDPDVQRLWRALACVRERTGLAAPALIAFEVGNAVHRKRQGAIVGASLQDRVDRVRAALATLDILPFQDDAKAATGRITEGSKISFYDASYLAACRMARRALTTADRGQAAHARALDIPVYELPEDLEKLERDYAPPAT